MSGILPGSVKVWLVGAELGIRPLAGALELAQTCWARGPLPIRPDPVGLVAPAGVKSPRFESLHLVRGDGAECRERVLQRELHSSGR